MRVKESHVHGQTYCRWALPISGAANTRSAWPRVIEARHSQTSLRRTHKFSSRGPGQRGFNFRPPSFPAPPCCEHAPAVPSRHSTAPSHSSPQTAPRLRPGRPKTRLIQGKAVDHLHPQSRLWAPRTCAQPNVRSTQRPPLVITSSLFVLDSCARRQGGN